MDGSDTRRGMPSAHHRFAMLHRGSEWLGSPEAFGVGAEAALIASIVHERPERLPELKIELRGMGWNVRS